MREPAKLDPYEIENLRYSHSKLGERAAERLAWLEREHDRLVRERTQVQRSQSPLRVRPISAS